MTLPLRSTPAASLRKGHWKLIRFFADHPDGSDRYELYNLAIDPGELHDKTSAETERFSQLREILEKRLQETEAIIPQRNPAYRRK
jgi:arylsulfatase A-like enzyme